jgi:hypothetical protein
LPVDTKYTTEAAVAEEDRTRTAVSYQRLLLSKVGMKGGNFKLRGRSAIPFLSIQSVILTFSGTYITNVHHFPKDLTAAFQLT